MRFVMIDPDYGMLVQHWLLPLQSCVGLSPGWASADGRLTSQFPISARASHVFLAIPGTRLLMQIKRSMGLPFAHAQHRLPGKHALAGPSVFQKTVGIR
jgi:hypothetical protein